MSGTQIKQPSVSIALANADSTVQITDQQVLIVGQQNAGTAVSGDLEQNIGTAGEEDALYGADSMLAEEIREFRKINKVNRVDAIGIDDDGSGVPRVVTFTVAGPATAAGTVTVITGSQVNHSFSVAVASADSETDVADAITAAINADLSVPFTAGNVAGLVTLTAVNDGTVANDLGIEVITAAAGITLSVQIAEDTAGATDPTLTGILDVATDRYQTLVWPYKDTTVVAAYLLARQDPTNAILDGVAIYNIQGTLSEALAILNALNDRNLVPFVDKTTDETTGTVKGYLGPAMNEASYVKSAQFAAIHALRLTSGQNIASFLTSSASRDQFGGPALGSLPYFNTPFANLPLIRAGRGWTETEIEQLTTAGGSVLGVNVGGTGVISGEVVTTFKTDAASNEDPTFKFLNYVVTTSQIREYYDSNLRAQYAQSRLTEGSAAPGRDMVNAVMIRAFCEKLYQDLSGTDFVLVQAGDDAFKFYKQNLTVELDLSTGTVTITMLTPIVTQLRTIIATIKIAFSTQA